MLLGQKNNGRPMSFHAVIYGGQRTRLPQESITGEVQRGVN